MAAKFHWSVKVKRPDGVKAGDRFKAHGALLSLYDDGDLIAASDMAPDADVEVVGNEVRPLGA